MFLRSDSREPHETSRRRWAVLALLACLVAAGVLRLTGLDYALPEFGGHDERVFLEQTEFFRSGKQPAAGDEWVLTAYPHLLPRLGALLPSPGSGAAPAATLDEALVRAAAPWTQLRTLLALLSLASVPLTWLLARRWMSALGACVAAGLVATSLLHITLSIQQKPHAVAAGLDLLALLAALELVRKPSPLRCLLAGAAAALAIGSLHSAALCLPPLCAALLVVPRRALPGAARRLAATLLPVAASVALFYPFFLSTVQASSGGSPRGAGLAGFFGFVAGNLRGARWARLATSLVEIDPVLCVLALAGLLLLAWQCSRARRFGELLRGEPLVVLAFVVPYAIVLGAYEGTLLRFLLPFIPLAACAGGWAVECAARALAARWPATRARLCAGSGAALAVALPLWPAAHFAWMRTQPTPMDQAARWIEEHVDPSETIAVLPYRDLPLAYAPAAARANAEVEHRSQWSEWQLAHPDALGGARAWKVLVEPGGRPDSRLAFEHDALAYLRGFGVRWVVLDLSGGGQDVLAKIATRAARFAPSREDDGRERGLTLVGTGFDPLRPSAARILRMQSLGTTVEIWRLP